MIDRNQDDAKTAFFICQLHTMHIHVHPHDDGLRHMLLENRDGKQMRYCWGGRLWLWHEFLLAFGLVLKHSRFPHSMYIFMYVCIVARVVYTFGSLHPIPFQQVGYLYCLIVDHLTTRTIFMKDAILYLFLRREKTIFSKTKGAPLDAWMRKTYFYVRFWTIQGIIGHLNFSLKVPMNTIQW